MNWKPNFLATGVGSLPYEEPEKAIELVWRSLPSIPHWPQLPKCGAENSFVGQYLRAFLETGAIIDVEQPKFLVDAPDWSERMTKFYELYLLAENDDEKALEAFGFSKEGAIGLEKFCKDLEEKGKRDALFLKGQISGPVTVGMVVKGKSSRACYYDEQLRDMLVKSLAMNARWQMKRLGKYGLPVLMSIDDPGLYGFGSSTHVTFRREDLISNINDIADEIIKQGGIPGSHVCAGMDWTLLFDSKVQIVNFDAYEYMTSMIVVAGPLQNFLERGGILSWGIVPTSNKVLDETVDSLRERLEKNISELVKRGVSEELLRSQSLLTPSCGTGALEVPVSERIYSLLHDLSQQMRN